MKGVCFYLDEVTGSLAADDVDLPVHDGDDLSQRETDGWETEHTNTHKCAFL